MTKKIRIKSNKKVSMNEQRQELLRPDLVYIPLISHNNVNCVAVVNVGDKVYKGSLVGKRVTDDFPILSSISGIVLEIKDRLYINNKLVPTIVIKNDFKEKVVKVNRVNEDIGKLSKEEFINRLKKHGVTGLSGDDFPTYLKYATEDKLKILLVNGVECEPYITSDYMIMKKFSEEILETIDAIITIMGLERAVIAIRDDEKDIKQMFESILGTYPLIDVVVVKDYYPVGWEKRLMKEVLHINYSGHPSQGGVVVNNVATIYEIYEALRYDKPLTEKYVTITGDMIKEPQNVFVKIGTSLSEVIETIGGYKETEGDVVCSANGLMMGQTLSSTETMVVKPLTGIVINKYVSEVETECMNCGKCVSVCPVNITPVAVVKNINKVKILKKLNCEKCINCGLCSYVCPAKINVRAKVALAKSEVLK